MLTRLLKYIKFSSLPLFTRFVVKIFPFCTFLRDFALFYVQETSSYPVYLKNNICFKTHHLKPQFAYSCCQWLRLARFYLSDIFY